MRRREFIAGLGGAVAWPLVARGQTGKTHRIGFLSPLLASSPFVAAFREGLRLPAGCNCPENKKPPQLGRAQSH
jgi:hypothetical protein